MGGEAKCHLPKPLGTQKNIKKKIKLQKVRSPQCALTAVQPRDGPAGDDEDVRRPQFGQPHEEVAHDGEDIDHQHGLHPAGRQHGSALRPQPARTAAGKSQRGKGNGDTQQGGSRGA